MPRALPKRKPFPRTPKKREDMAYRLRVVLRLMRERNQGRRGEG